MVVNLQCQTAQVHSLALYTHQLYVLLIAILNHLITLIKNYLKYVTKIMINSTKLVINHIRAAPVLWELDSIIILSSSSNSEALAIMHIGKTLTWHFEAYAIIEVK